jgi:hypothetical protein
MSVRKAARDSPRRIDLGPMTLIVIHRQRNDEMAALACNCGADHRVEPARE